MATQPGHKKAPTASKARSSTAYFEFPTGIPNSMTVANCTTPTATPNRANCANAVGDFTSVGSYTGTAGTYGAFDQGGNAWEWTEDQDPDPDRSEFRIIRGG